MRKRHPSAAAKQAVYRTRHRESFLLKQLQLKLRNARETTDELGELQGTRYMVEAIPIPRLLAESIDAREKTQGVSAGVQLKTFVLAGAEVIHRAIDVALARGIVTPDDQSKLVDRLAR